MPDSTALGPSTLWAHHHQKDLTEGSLWAEKSDHTQEEVALYNVIEGFRGMFKGPQCGLKALGLAPLSS